jgi:hypothetical protein
LGPVAGSAAAGGAGGNPTDGEAIEDRGAGGGTAALECVIVRVRIRGAGMPALPADAGAGNAGSGRTAGSA